MRLRRLPRDKHITPLIRYCIETPGRILPSFAWGAIARKEVIIAGGLLALLVSLSRMSVYPPHGSLSVAFADSAWHNDVLGPCWTLCLIKRCKSCSLHWSFHLAGNKREICTASPVINGQTHDHLAHACSLQCTEFVTPLSRVLQAANRKALLQCNECLMTCIRCFHGRPAYL